MKNIISFRFTVVLSILAAVLVLAFSLALAGSHNSGLTAQADTAIPRGTTNCQTITGGPVLNPFQISESGSGCTDFSLLAVKNVTQGTGYVVGGNINASAGDTIRVEMYVHNGTVDLPEDTAKNVMIKTNLPSGSGVISAEAWANNAPRIYSSNKGGNINLNLGSGQTLQVVSGSGKIYDRYANFISSNISPESIVAGGASLGDMRGCFDFARFVTFDLKVQAVATPTPTPPTPTPTPTNPPRVINSVQPGQVCSGSEVMIYGSNLDQTVQAFNSVGQRWTTKDTNWVNSDHTQVRYKALLNPGAYQIKVGPTLSDVSNAVTLNVTNCSTPTPTPTWTPTPTPTWTPTPTPTPGPVSVDIYTSPSLVCWGHSATISWNSQNAAHVYLSGFGGTPIEVDKSGSKTVFPTQTKTYTIQAVGNSGFSAYDSTTVIVDNCSTPTPQPVSGQISVSPSVVSCGQSATIYWSTSGDVSSVNIDKIGQVATSGSRTINPSSTTTYNMTVYGTSGSQDYDSATLTVQSCYIDSININKTARNITQGSGEQETVSAKFGDTIEFILRVYRNSNNNYYGNFRVVDNLPGGLNYVSGSTTVDGNYYSDGIVSGGLWLNNYWNSNPVIKFRATVNANQVNLTNTAFVYGDSGSASDSAYVNVYDNYSNYGSLSITKTVANISQNNIESYSVSAKKGETLEFRLRVKNTSNIPVYNVIVSDMIAGGLQYSPNSTSANGVMTGEGLVNSGLNIGTLNSGQETEVKFYSTVTASGRNDFTNTAQVRADGVGSISSNTVTISESGGVVAGAISIRTGASLLFPILGAVLITILSGGLILLKKKF